MQLKKIVLFIIVLIVSLQIFSQDINRVSVRIIEGEERIVMTPDKAREIATDLIEGDSCCDKSSYLEKKIETLSLIVEGDSLDLKRSKEISNKRYQQLDLCEERLLNQQQSEEIMKQELRKEKIKKVKSTIVGTLLGVIVGTLIK